MISVDDKSCAFTCTCKPQEMVACASNFLRASQTLNNCSIPGSPERIGEIISFPSTPREPSLLTHQHVLTSFIKPSEVTQEPRVLFQYKQSILNSFKTS